MTTTTELLMPNQWICHHNKDVKTSNILIEEQKTNIMKELIKIAENELRESESARAQCLHHLREWIKQNSDIENCLTDDTFLLRFLRVKKFSLQMAEQTLLKYLNFRKRFKDIMYVMDHTELKIDTLISNGYIFVSPFRDRHGRRVIIYDLGKFDLEVYNGTDLGRAHAITFETLMDDEENQILGITHIADVGAFGPSHVTLFSISDFSCIIRWGEQSFPMRHKEIHLLNLSKPVKYVLDFAKSNMSPKLKERVKLHENQDQLHQHVDKRCLPAELGGKMPAKEMIKMWKAELAAKATRLLSFDKMNLLSDKGIISRKNLPERDDTGAGSLAGSFRKLEVD